MSFIINPYRFFGEVAFPTIASLEMRVRADDVVLSGSRITQMNDLSGNDYHLVEVSSSGPTLSATGGPNSTPVAQFDGTADYLRRTGMTSWGASAKHHFIILSQDTWVDGDFLYRHIGVNESVRQLGTTPEIKQDDGATETNTVSPTLGTFYLLQAFHDGTSTSFQQLNNGSPVTGGDPGSIGGTTEFYLASSNTPDRFTDINVAELAIFSAQVTGSDLTDLMAYFSNRYGLF
jgi:hypothetical protein